MDESKIELAHYDFSRYVNRSKWASLWLQIKEITSAEPRSVLEIGVGTGLLGTVLKHFDIHYESLDVNSNLKPTHVGSATAMPFESRQFDLVACFQVLEHLPYTDFVPALSEIRRVASRQVVISLPDAQPTWSVRISAPRIGARSFFSRIPGIRPRKHKTGGAHHWEINKRGYPLEQIMADMASAGLNVTSTYRTPESPRHRFFVCAVDPVEQ